MKRKVVIYNTNSSPATFADAARGKSYVYRLECGHTMSGDYRRNFKGSKVQPKNLDCKQCDASGPLYRF